MTYQNIEIQLKCTQREIYSFDYTCQKGREADNKPIKYVSQNNTKATTD